MPARKLGLPPVVPRELAEGLAAIRAAAEVPADFPAEVEAAAEQAACEPKLPGLDRTDLELITIDPADSRDLDQALHIARGRVGQHRIVRIHELGKFSVQRCDDFRRATVASVT